MTSIERMIRIWTPREDRVLRKFYEARGSEFCSRKLRSRSRRAVQQRAIHLGISKDSLYGLYPIPKGDVVDTEASLPQERDPWSWDPVSAVAGHFPRLRPKAPSPPTSEPRLAQVIQLPNPRGGQPTADLSGATFGRIRVVRYHGRNASDSTWNCLCDPKLGGCGKEFVAPGAGVVCRKSCGCEYMHFHEYDGLRLTLPQWSAEMKRRGINIGVPTLRNRINAMKWPIEKALTTPVNSALARDRLWVFYEYDGLRLTLPKWTEEMKRRGVEVKTQTLRHRLFLGWPIEKALTTPVDQRFSHTGSRRPAGRKGE